MSESMLRAPFPWFGGKSLAAKYVWAALGDVAHYVEPFAGSLAVLLSRPHEARIETVNDLDHYIVNFWRAVQHAPDEVAYWADQPVNEADLTARHIWLVNTGQERIARLLGDPDSYDAKVAGWWAWGICCWIGSGWCSGKGPWGAVDGQLVHLGNAGRGVKRQRVHLGDAGRGVNAGLLEWMESLAARLRYVRVCCGDWQRVVTKGAMTHGRTLGIFLDPPYDQALRTSAIYNRDSEGISAQVRRWAIAHGDDPRYRIVLAGYVGEHDMPDDWRVIAWKARRTCGRSTKQDSGNRRKERLWLSPACLAMQPTGAQSALFAEAGT